MNLYNLKSNSDAEAYSYNGLGIYMIDILGNKLFIWTKIITLANPNDTSSDIISYEYVKYSQIDVDSIGEGNIDADTCYIKLSNSSKGRTYWTKDDMDEITGDTLPDHNGQADQKNIVIYIDPKSDTIKLIFNSKTIEATTKGSAGHLENKMKIQ